MWFDYFLYVKNDKMSFKMTVLAYLKTHDSWWAPVRWDIVRWEIVSGFLSYYHRGGTDRGVQPVSSSFVPYSRDRGYM